MRIGVNRKKTTHYKALLESKAFIVIGGYMDQLLNIVLEFERLLSLEYRFILGKNKTIYDVNISFDKRDFYHLAGLHKLNDLQFLHKNATAVYADIKRGRLTISRIQRSLHYNEIENRINALAHLEEFLDTAFEVYKYDIKKANGSRINADYLIRNKILDSIGLCFFVKNRDTFIGTSFFLQDRKDYAVNQMKLTLLKKEKVNVITKNVNLLYIKDDFRI